MSTYSATTRFSNAKPERIREYNKDTRSMVVSISKIEGLSSSSFSLVASTTCPQVYSAHTVTPDQQVTKANRTKIKAVDLALEVPTALLRSLCWWNVATKAGVRGTLKD